MFHLPPGSFGASLAGHCAASGAFDRRGVVGPGGSSFVGLCSRRFTLRPPGPVLPDTTDRPSFPPFYPNCTRAFTEREDRYGPCRGRHWPPDAPSCPPLANNDVAGRRRRSVAELLHAETAAFGIATVTGRAACLFVSPMGLLPSMLLACDAPVTGHVLRGFLFSGGIPGRLGLGLGGGFLRERSWQRSFSPSPSCPRAWPPSARISVMRRVIRSWRVTALALRILAATLLEGDDLRAAGQLDHLGHDGGPLDRGRTDLHVVAIGQHQHIGDRDALARSGGEGRSTVITSSAATRYCLPPVLITANIVFILVFDPALRRRKAVGAGFFASFRETIMMRTHRSSAPGACKTCKSC